MDAIVMNSKNSETSDSHRLLPNLSDKINSRSYKYDSLSSLSICYKWKNIKKSYKNNHLDYQLQHEMRNWNYLMDHILYQIFKTVLHILKKTWRKDSSIRVYVNKIVNGITFKIKTGYYLELLTPETMKLIGITKSKITKDENGENVPYLEITDAVLVHCSILNNYYQQDPRALYTFDLNKLFGQLFDILPKSLISLKIFNSKFSYIKVRLSPFKTNCVNCFIETPLKMIKNAFYFILKALFGLKIFKFLSWLFGHGHVEETAWLER